MTTWSLQPMLEVNVTRSWMEWKVWQQRVPSSPFRMPLLAESTGLISLPSAIQLISVILSSISASSKAWSSIHQMNRELKRCVQEEGR
jgi:hypothetical protein